MNVASFTVTITDHTKPGRTLLDLVQNGSGNGYTVVGTVQGNVGWTKVGYRGIQSLVGTLYAGDAGTANDGSQQGRTIVVNGVWDRDDYGSPISLEVYVRGGADGDKFNLMIEGE